MVGVFLPLAGVWLATPSANISATFTSAIFRAKIGVGEMYRLFNAPYLLAIDLIHSVATVVAAMTASEVIRPIRCKRIFYFFAFKAFKALHRYGSIFESQ